MSKPLWSTTGLAAALLVAAALAAAFASAAPMPGSKDAPWRADQLLQPKRLVAALSGPVARRPVLLHVGFSVLYPGGNIPGSRAVGPTSRPEGIAELKRVAASLPRDAAIVLYCGCCPWSHCPNVAPAFRTMRNLGFKHVEVLYIPTNMQKDWVDRGYPLVGK